MKAIVYRGEGDIRSEDVAEPTLETPTDAIVRLTGSAICGTDLHFVRQSFKGVKPGTILGHEGVGIVEQLGEHVRNFAPGDRVVICSTIACGSCVYCRAGYYSQCDNANPNGKQAGTAFFGGPETTGPFNGLQAEKARVPFAHIGMVRIPDAVTDDQAILVSDIFPTAYFGAELADIHPGHVVVVLGCGPVGLATILSAHLMSAGRIIAVDHENDRLEKARELGAEIVNFDDEDPMETVRELTGGIGPDRVIDAVGIDAEKPGTDREKDKTFAAGNAPKTALDWAVEMLAKAGTLSIIGVYPLEFTTFPIGKAMNKNLTLRMGNCNHRKYVPMLLDLIASGKVDPTRIISQKEPLKAGIDAYKAFDEHEPGWIKVKLEPAEA
jgi:threonine dehydrogenase-like Zn-dependent dehydrogenase